MLAGEPRAVWHLAALSALHQILNNAGVLPGTGGFGFGLHPPKSWRYVQSECVRLTGDVRTASEICSLMGPSAVVVLKSPSTAVYSTGSSVNGKVQTPGGYSKSLICLKMDFKAVPTGDSRAVAADQ